MTFHYDTLATADNGAVRPRFGHASVADDRQTQPVLLLHAHLYCPSWDTPLSICRDPHSGVLPLLVHSRSRGWRQATSSTGCSSM